MQETSVWLFEEPELFVRVDCLPHLPSRIRLAHLNLYVTIDQLKTINHAIEAALNDLALPKETSK